MIPHLDCWIAYAVIVVSIFLASLWDSHKRASR